MSRFGRVQVREFLQLRGVNVANENLNASRRNIRWDSNLLGVSCRAPWGECHRYAQERFLAGMPSLRDQRIDHYHQHLWDTCSHEQEVVYVLAILAVRDEFTTRGDLRDLLNMLGVDATMFLVEKAVEKVRHVLRVSDARSIAIRHNSPREFISRSARSPCSRRSIAHSSPGTRRILTETRRGDIASDTCSNSVSTRQRWLLVMTNGWREKLGQPLRPMHEIQRNLDIAWRAAAVQKDLVGCRWHRPPGADG